MSRKTYMPPHVARVSGRLSPYQKLVRSVLQRDNHHCQTCGKDTKDIDYILHPLNGGREGYKNRMACCSTCKRKRKKTVHDPKSQYVIYNMSEI